MLLLVNDPNLCVLYTCVRTCVCVGHQTAALGCAVVTDAVLWSRVAGAASAKLDGVGLDAALSWKLTAVMELTMTEVTFYIIYHIISFFSLSILPL